MIDWIKNLFKYKPVFLVTEYHPENEKDYGISQPVKEIVKTFYEPRRWRIEKVAYDPYGIYYAGFYKCFEVIDTKTHERYYFASNEYSLVCLDYGIVTGGWFVPKTIGEHSLPSWVTEEEKKYIKKHADCVLQNLHQRILVVRDRKKRADELQSEKRQKQERNRLKEIYCS